ncbi:VWA domain-containing protein [Stigmatella sp. ncwal1]|uniref:VWA domain-containing protein n=1 Tax=Stigmatella ashevillensis TaxID=2995309 RepID=A0ABT5D3V0_9BACT|nr:vWA domain-containing protein [Stigmatella ashevillena]MDC0708345.1 VWA domain-containing protein [Stigmatella ashevillena]
MIRLCLLAALLVASGCDNVAGDPGRGEAVPTVAPPRVSPVELLPPTVDRSITQRVEVRDPPVAPAVQVDVQRQVEGIVDILWVVDDSGSMANQRETLTLNFSRFLEELLRLQVRFQIGVISTNFADRGVLRGTTKIITGETPDPRQVFLQNTTFPTSSRARLEQGLRMMELALTEPHRSGANAGFLRPNAALAVIAVTDEDDGSYGDPAYYARFLRSLKGPGNENLSSLSIIGGTTPDGCFPPGEEIYFGGRADPSFRYSAVATRTGGIIGSICDASFESTLVKIASALNSLRRAFPLSLTPAPATLHVLVNGAPVPKDLVNGWQYRADTQSVTFLGHYVPPPGALLRFEYALASP